MADFISENSSDALRDAQPRIGILEKYTRAAQQLFTPERLLKAANLFSLFLLAGSSIAGAVAFASDNASSSKDPTSPTGKSLSPTIKIIPESDGQDKIVEAIHDRIVGDEKPSAAPSNNSIIGAFPGGGTSGVVGAASLLALNDYAFLVKELESNGGNISEALAKLKEAQTKGQTGNGFGVFNATVGSSIGALVQAFGESGQVSDGVCAFFKLDQNFLSIPRLVEGLVAAVTQQGSIPAAMNIPWLAQGLGGEFGASSLNMSAVADGSNNETPMYVVLTNRTTLEHYVVDSSNLSADELKDLILNQACYLPGIADAAGDADVGIKRDFDAKYSGKTIPINLNHSALDEASITVIFTNEPIGSPSFDGVVSKAMNRVALDASYIQTMNASETKRIRESADTKGALNEQELRNAENDTEKTLVFGLPQGEAILSSSELNKNVLQGAAQKAWLHTMLVLVRDSINNGDIQLPKGSELEITAPEKFGEPICYGVIKLDSRGRANAVMRSGNPNIESASREEKTPSSAKTQVSPVSGFDEDGMIALPQPIKPSAKGTARKATTYEAT